MDERRLASVVRLQLTGTERDTIRLPAVMSSRVWCLLCLVLDGFHFEWYTILLTTTTFSLLLEELQCGGSRSNLSYTHHHGLLSVNQKQTESCLNRVRQSESTQEVRQHAHTHVSKV